MWIHGSSARLYVSVAIMVLLYNAAWFHRQVKGSMYHCESRGDGPPASVMHFVVLYCWHVFGYAVFLLCNNAATGNDDCRRNKRGISGATIFRTKIQIKSINKMLKKKNKQKNHFLEHLKTEGGAHFHQDHLQVTSPDTVQSIKLSFSNVFFFSSSNNNKSSGSSNSINSNNSNHDNSNMRCIDTHSYYTNNSTTLTVVLSAE